MTAALDVGRHPRPWTALEFMNTDFGDIGRLYELEDGCIVMTPAPTRRHQQISRRLVNAIEAWMDQHGSGLRVEGPVNYRLGDDTVFAPDVIVYRADARDDLYLDPDEVEVLVEVTSANPGRDLVTKMARYAATGVPWYWIIDQQSLTVSIHELVGGGYRLVQKVDAGIPARLLGPVPLRLDPATLVR